MFCRNCSSTLPNGAAFCPNCGAPAQEGAGFCPGCGQTVNPADNVCPRCGYVLNASAPIYTAPKSRLVAGLLGIFLGTLGVHNFYLGHTNRGLTQLLLSTIGGILSCGIASLAVWIWALVEGISILTGSVNTDANGVMLKE